MDINAVCLANSCFIPAACYWVLKYSLWLLTLVYRSCGIREENSGRQAFCLFLFSFFLIWPFGVLFFCCFCFCLCLCLLVVFSDAPCSVGVDSKVPAQRHGSKQILCFEDIPSTPSCPLTRSSNILWVPGYPCVIRTTAVLLPHYIHMLANISMRINK